MAQTRGKSAIFANSGAASRWEKGLRFRVLPFFTSPTLRMSGHAGLAAAVPSVRVLASVGLHPSLRRDHPRASPCAGCGALGS